MQVMDQISRALPELLWLDRMTMIGTRITLAGQAFNSNAVANFMDNLDKVPEFQEPILSDMTAGGHRLQLHASPSTSRTSCPRPRQEGAGGRCGGAQAPPAAATHRGGDRRRGGARSTAAARGGARWRCRTGLEGKPLYYSAVVGLLVGGDDLRSRLQAPDRAAAGRDRPPGDAPRRRCRRRSRTGGRRSSSSRSSARRCAAWSWSWTSCSASCRRGATPPSCCAASGRSSSRATSASGASRLKNFVNKDFYSEWPIVINLTGGYHNLALFFDRISRFSRIINIENLNIAAARGSGDQTIAATFTVKTFIYKELPPTGGGEERQPGEALGRQGNANDHEQPTA